MWVGPALLVAGLVVGIGLGAVVGDSDSGAAGLVWLVSMVMLALGTLLCIAAGVGLVVARVRGAGS